MANKNNNIKRYMPEIFYPLYLKYKYRRMLGHSCDMKHPTRYTEKIQWGKLNRRDPIISELTDKIEVRNWVAEKIGEEYLIPTIGDCYEKVENLDFSSLPSSYVIKLNTGSGYNIIVKDNSKVDYEIIKKRIKEWLNSNFAFYTLELQYKNIVPKIYIEKYLLEDNMTDLPDYKFFCFNGRVFCSYTMVDYLFDHSNGKLGFFDRDYNLMPFYRMEYKPIIEQLPKPKNYEKMVEIAETLSQGFSHVRVDLYNIEGKIYFGEMTFSTNSGYCKFSPDEFDLILGEQWDINSGI